MDTQQAIGQRWGCRKYLDKPVEKEILGKILDAGRLAESAGNLQDRSFIIIKSQETKSAISELSGNQAWMQTAPVHIVVLSENKKLGKFFGPRGEKIYSIQDTSFSVQNMLLAATNLGINCSVVVGFNEEKLIQLLKIPAPAQPHAIITIGYPAEKPSQSAKYPLDQVVFFESYGNRVVTTSEEIAQKATEIKKDFVAATQIAKAQGKTIIGKVRDWFKKRKEERSAVDHFMEEPKQTVTELKKESHDEIPRQLPRRF